GEFRRLSALLLPFEASLEAVDQVARVAWRINRLGLQRATYRSVATVLLAPTAAAISAAYLAPIWFRALFALLLVAGLAVVTASAFILHSRWAQVREAVSRLEQRGGVAARDSVPRVGVRGDLPTLVGAVRGQRGASAALARRSAGHPRDPVDPRHRG